MDTESAPIKDPPNFMGAGFYSFLGRNSLKGIKLIISDMDHTLLTDDSKIPPHFSSYVVKLAQYGINFVAASGRPLCTLYAMFPDLKNKLIFIGDNGGVISYKGDIIFKSILKPEDYQSMIRFTNEETDGVPILCGLEAGFIDEKDASYQNYLRTFYSNTVLVNDLSQTEREANKFTVYFPRKNSKEHYETLFKPKYGDRFSVTVGDTVWIDIMNQGIHKGSAVQFLAKRMGLRPECMMAFGDTYNDIEMLQSVTYSYVVQNASADMRQYATFVADSNQNFGVLKAINKLIAALEDKPAQP